VVEPSLGIDRALYAMLEYAYIEQGKRVILKVPRDIAGINAAVFPLVDKDGLSEVANKITGMLLDENFIIDYNPSGSIGRRYARADEIGIPICITVDYQTLQDGTVTLRDLYSWRQIRTKLRASQPFYAIYLCKKIGFDQMGTAFTLLKET